MKKAIVIVAVLGLLAPTVVNAAVSSRSSSRSSTSSRPSTSTRTTTGSSGRTVPKTTTTYSGRSYAYTDSYNSFNVSNMVLWYLILSESTKNADRGDGSVRDIYEDQLSAIKEKMKKHEQLPTYEQTVEQMVKVFGGLNISPQEIGATYWHTYAYYGPAPERKL